jgi:hypothetical protein
MEDVHDLALTAGQVDVGVSGHHLRELFRHARIYSRRRNEVKRNVPSLFGDGAMADNCGESSVYYLSGSPVEAKIREASDFPGDHDDLFGPVSFYRDDGIGVLSRCSGRRPKYCRQGQKQPCAEPGDP